METILRPIRQIDYLRTLTLNEIIQQAIQYDMWNGMIIWGEKRLGKSALALRKLRYAWGSWERALQHLVFTHTEFMSIFHKYRERVGQLLDEEGVPLEKVIQNRCRGVV